MASSVNLAMEHTERVLSEYLESWQNKDITYFHFFIKERIYIKTNWKALAVLS